MMLSPTQIRNLGQLLLAIFAFLFLALTLPLHAQSQEVGVSAAVRGSVAINAQSARSGQDVFLGDRVVTQVQSGMQVLLLDESTFTVGENNDLIIDRFVYDPDRSAGEIAARASQGFLRFVSGGVGAVAPENVEITTPSATIGVRGTVVDVVIGQAAIDLARQLGQIDGISNLDPATAVFVLLRGPSTAYSGITQRGRVIVSTPAGQVSIRRAGFAVFVPNAGAVPSNSFAVPNAVSEQIISSIEVPTVGATSAVPGVDVTTLPGIDPLPDGSLPRLGDPNPDGDLHNIIERVLGGEEGEQVENGTPRGETDPATDLCAQDPGPGCPGFTLFNQET